MTSTLDQLKLTPQRNKITFRWTDRTSISSIINPNIGSVIKILESAHDIKLADSDILSIQSNSLNNSWIKKNESTLSRVRFYKEIIWLSDKKYIIYRNPNTFNQPDDTIRSVLYNLLDGIINKQDNKSLTCIGGEMYIFSKILSYTSGYFYTDFPSIYDDTLLNIPKYKPANISLVNYDTCTIPSPPTYFLIANTSFNGLGANLAKQITEKGYEMILIISCNCKSFARDYLILSEQYQIINRFIIKTNYQVELICLSPKRKI